MFHPKEKPHLYHSSDLEVNFSGSEIGDSKNPYIYGFKNGKLEVKEWVREGNKIKISGILSGELPEVVLIGKSTNKIQFNNVKFNNVLVEVQ